METKFNKDKGIQILRYFVNNGLRDLYQIGKAMYFADLYHLEHHGFFIAGDKYIAMEAGPVPSGFYDILKEVRNRKSAYGVDARKNSFFRSEAPDLAFLSRADLESLDHGVAQVFDLDFGRIKDKSHDAAYYKTDLNRPIKITDIAAMFENRAELIDYLSR